MISTIMYATTNTAAKTITTISPRSKLSWRSNSMEAGIPRAAFGPGQIPTHDSQARAGIAGAGIYRKRRKRTGRAGIWFGTLAAPCHFPVRAASRTFFGLCLCQQIDPGSAKVGFCLHLWQPLYCPFDRIAACLSRYESVDVESRSGTYEQSRWLSYTTSPI